MCILFRLVGSRQRESADGAWTGRIHSLTGLFLRQGCGGERLLSGENEERGFPRGGPANSASFTHIHVA